MAGGEVEEGERKIGYPLFRTVNLLQAQKQAEQSWRRKAIRFAMSRYILPACYCQLALHSLELGEVD